MTATVFVNVQDLSHDENKCAGNHIKASYPKSAKKTSWWCGSRGLQS